MAAPTLKPRFTALLGLFVCALLAWAALSVESAGAQTASVSAASKGACTKAKAKAKRRLAKKARIRCGTGGGTGSGGGTTTTPPPAPTPTPTPTPTTDPTPTPNPDCPLASPGAAIGMTLPASGTVVSSDTASNPDPIPFWGELDCQNSS